MRTNATSARTSGLRLRWPVWVAVALALALAAIVAHRVWGPAERTEPPALAAASPPHRLPSAQSPAAQSPAAQSPAAQMQRSRVGASSAGTAVGGPQPVPAVSHDERMHGGGSPVEDRTAPRGAEERPGAAELPPRSPRSEQRGGLTISNTCSVPVEVIWLDFEGHERSYGRLPRGGLLTQNSYIGHVWIVRAADLPAGVQAAYQPDIVRFAVTSEATYVETCSEDDPRYDETPPETVNTLCSVASSHQIRMEIENRCTVPVEFLWIAFDCSPSTRGWIEPGEVFHQTTYLGHVWKARDADGNVLAHIVASEENAQSPLTCLR